MSFRFQSWATAEALCGVWQKTQMRGHGLQTVDGDRAVHETRRIHLDRLGLEDAEMLVEPRPPQEIDAVAGLQHRLLLARAAAAHQAEMPAMGSAVFWSRMKIWP